MADTKLSDLPFGAAVANADILLGLQSGADIKWTASQLATYAVSYNARLADIAGVTYAQGDILYYNGANIVNLAASTAGYVLTTHGAGTSPTWTAASSGDVVGPASAVDGHLATFNGTTGKLIKDGGVAPTGTNTGDETGARVATLLHAAALKSALVDADEVNGTDSASSFSLIRTTWTSVKAFLKAYFDGLYQALDSDLTTLAGLTATTDNFIISVSSAWASRTPVQAAATLQGDGLTSAQVGFRNIPQNSQSAAYTTVAADSGKHILHPSGDANARTFTIDSNANVAYPIGTAITFVNQTSQVVSIAITTDTMTLANSTTTGTRSLAQNGVATALKIASTSWIISGTGLT